MKRSKKAQCHIDDIQKEIIGLSIGFTRTRRLPSTRLRHRRGFQLSGQNGFQVTRGIAGLKPLFIRS